MPLPKNYSTPIRLSAKDQAFNQIQQWIIDGTLNPGEKMNDGKLAEALGISRTPVREALQTLQAQGFVEMRPGKETRVTLVKTEDISKILPPLAVLQSLSAELATPTIQQDLIDSLRNINSKFSEAVKNADFYLALKLDEQFHGMIVEVTDNSYILNMISMLQAHVRRLFFHKSIILTSTSIEEHEEILNAFENRDKDKASALMRNNWLRPIEEFNSRIHE
jgi:DNA-binding GntR family transcriptional regulator